MITFTAIHVVVSLIGIATGLVVAAGLLNSKRLGGWTIVFLASTIATSLTGFGFPFSRLLPSHIIGAIFARRPGGDALRAIHSADGWQLAID